MIQTSILKKFRTIYELFDIEMIQMCVSWGVIGGSLISFFIVQPLYSDISSGITAFVACFAAF